MQNYRQIPIRTIFVWSFLAMAIILLIILLDVGKNVYTEWLWFESVDFQEVYRTVIMTRVWLFAAGALVSLVLFTANAFIALRLGRLNEPSMLPPETIVLIRSLTRLSLVFGAVILSLVFGSIVAGQWETLLRFNNSVPFVDAQGAEITEPLYGRNPAFYIFTLPLWRFGQMFGVGMMAILLVEALGVYAAGYSLRGFRLYFSSAVKIHVLTLGAILALFVAWSYWFDIQELVLSTRGLDGNLFGAGATDVSAVTLTLRIMIVATVILAAVLIATAFQRSFGIALTAFSIWTGASIVLLTVLPAGYQRLAVQPSELAREAPYIERNITMTREAYGIGDIKVAQFPINDGPPPVAAITNPVVVENIRLWDDVPMLDTLNQIQFFRPYYTFLDVDVDRYVVGDRVRQVMLAARELTPEQLPGEAQSWVARRLQYTHGYGVAMSPVNEFTSEGRPNFFLKDLPPQAIEPLLALDRPEVYFGEKTDYYVIVNSKTQEFNYPTQEEGPRFAKYEGGGGVQLSSFLRKAAFAWRLGDFNLLISNEVTPESRLLFYRQIQGRINRIAPFLELDSDPYAVVADGKLVWMQDAFTTTNRFPYSQPYNADVNYIRNSVKVVVDAYDGSMTFYVVTPDDALISTYMKIFPEIFRPFADMPAELQKHVRYPAGLFAIQESMYRTYHVDDPQVFFSKEDTWSRPREIFNDRQQNMDPYYVNMPVPGEVDAEFLLLLPFTPFNRPNLIAWMAARNDPEHYGELVVFNFPRAQQVDGPAQVEARIDNDPLIAQQFTLWGQQGSRIIRGNLLVIPIEGNLLYVEPVYLQAASLAFPELKRVIVAIGSSRPAMEPTLDLAMEVALGRRAPSGPTQDGGPITQPPTGTPAPRPPTPTAIPTPGFGTPQPTPDIDQLIAQLDELLRQLKQLRLTPTPTS